MTFPEKSALAMTGILVLVFGWYFTLVLGPVAQSPAREIAWKGLMVPVVLFMIVLATVSHIALAIVFPRQANARPDERDRLIGLHSERIAGYVLAVGVWAGIGLALVGAAPFWLAQTLIAALVLAQITDGVVKVALYRRHG
jgi:hypothetical protein